MFHAASKMLSFNPVQVPRIDLMEHYDAVFTELSVTSLGNVKMVAALAPFKPATMWTTVVPTPSIFASLLLHGVYPMAPSPDGDHSLGLDGLDAFLEYGPMLRAMRGREWVLTAHAVSSSDADVNLFSLPCGALLAPVVPLERKLNANTAMGVEVTFASLPKTATFSALQHGRRAQWTPLSGSTIVRRVGDVFVVAVTVTNGIAMIRVNVTG